MAEIICRETGCAFNQGDGCLKSVVVLEKISMIPELKRGRLVTCQQYEERHDWNGEVG